MIDMLCRYYTKIDIIISTTASLGLLGVKRQRIRHHGIKYKWMSTRRVLPPPGSEFRIWRRASGQGSAVGTANRIISWTSATNAGERCPKNQNATIYYYYSWTTKCYNRIRVRSPLVVIFRRRSVAPPSPDTTTFSVFFSVADIVGGGGGGSNQPATSDHRHRGSTTD